MAGLAFKTLGGAGEDIVLIHGFGSDRLSWLATSPALMAVARVHALDLPGHGDSPADVADASPLALARRVTGTLAEHGLGRVHLVGHSLGAGLALLIAAQQPERVASLSLIAPAGLGFGVDRAFLAAYPELVDPQTIMAMLRKLVVQPLLINKMMVQRVQAHLTRDGVRETLRAISKGLVHHEAELSKAAETITSLDLPRLTLWGERDVINPLDQERLQAFGGVRHVIANTGHLPHIENPKLANEHITNFLKHNVAA